MASTNTSEGSKRDTPSANPGENTRIERSATVSEAMAGQRYDQIAAKLFPEFSRGKLQSWILSGELTADQQQCKPRQKLVAGVVLKLDAEYTPVSEWVAEDRPINIVFEDEHILVVNKPANCVVHPAAGLAMCELMSMQGQEIHTVDIEGLQAHSHCSCCVRKHYAGHSAHAVLGRRSS